MVLMLLFGPGRGPKSLLMQVLLVLVMVLVLMVVVLVVVLLLLVAVLLLLLVGPGRGPIPALLLFALQLCVATNVTLGHQVHPAPVGLRLSLPYQT